MSRTLRFLVGVLTVAAALTAVSATERRNIRFKVLGVEEGLSQSAINAVLQDRDGIMWFGTEDGLNRYDGYSVEVFKHEPRNPESLASSFVECLYQDGSGRLWVGTAGGGLNRYDPETGAFVRYQHDPHDLSSLSHDTVKAIVEGGDGRLWVGTDRGGLNVFDPETGGFLRYRHDAERPTSLSSDRVRSLLVDREGTLWIGTYGGGLNRLQSGGGSFTRYLHDPGDEGSLSDDRVDTIFEDDGGVLWVSTYGGGLNRMDPGTRRFTRFLHDPAEPGSLSANRVRSVLRDRDGTLWVATEAGLNEWDPKERRFLHYHHRVEDPGSLSDDNVTVLFQDAGGLLWVGTKAGGLNRWNAAVGSFRHVSTDPQTPTPLSHSVVTSFAETGDGTLWVGTFGGGLNRIKDERLEVVLAANSGLVDDRVMSLLADADGGLWIGTYGSGLQHYDVGSGEFRHWSHDPDDPQSLGANGVMTLFIDHGGSLWAGTYEGGLNRMLAGGRGFQRYRHDPDDPATLGSDVVSALTEGADGTLWIATGGGGLYSLDPMRESLEGYRSRPMDPDSLSSDDIWALHEDATGTLWIGTGGGGLSAWKAEDREQGTVRFVSYSERDGLPNNTIYGIRPDAAGYLWLSTNGGLARFNPEEGEFRRFDTTHGLQSREFNFGAHFTNARGELFFGGVNGYNVFYPDEVRQNPYVPPVILTGFFRNSEPAAFPEGELVLDYRDESVSFEFAALDYTAPERNRYAYMLEGFDNDWNELGTMRRATYTNLDSGDYRLLVRAANADGTWNESAYEMAVTVLAPPWRTWWAYGLYAGLLGFTVMTYTRAQSGKLRREEAYSRKLEDEVASRTEELEQRAQELKTLNHKLEDASLTDPLTGLRNRRFLKTQVVPRMEADLQSGVTREPKLGGVFLMLDLDGLKGANDTWGHDAGDQILLQTRDVLLRTCRATDTIVRLGGDEFLIVARELDLDAAEALAERIRQNVERHVYAVRHGDEARITVSVGLAPYPFVTESPTALNWEQVVKLADRALYAAKNRGKDRWISVAGRDGLEPHELGRLVRDDLTELAERGLVELHSSAA